MEKISIDEVRKVLYFIMRGYEVPDIIYKVVREVAKREVEDKKRVVIIKRDPNIHRDRIQAAYVKIVDGETIEIHPGMVGGFGADFDGDQMAIFAPLSKQAQEEAKKKMLTIYTSNSLNSSNYRFTNEMLMGFYAVTSEVSNNSPINISDPEELKKLHPATIVKYNHPKKGVMVLSAGRLMFNLCLPDWYPVVDTVVNKKVVNEILSKILDKDPESFSSTFDKLQVFGFLSATKYPKTISLDLLSDLPKELYVLKEMLIKEKSLEKQMEIISKMESILKEHLKKNVPTLYAFIESGAAKGIGQLRQIMVAKGLFTDPKGNILPPVARSMNEGYSPEEYFRASSGARKGIINRVKVTSKGGYLYRKMIYVMASTIANKNRKDCDTKMFLKIKLTPEMFKKLKGRYVQERYGGKIQEVNEGMIGKMISLRSPVYCKTYDICSLCYGKLLEQLNTNNVGLIAAQECTSLSEKIMKAFHTGGAVSFEVFNIMKALKENVETDMEKIIDEVFEQKEDYLVSRDKILVNINKNMYRKFGEQIEVSDEKKEIRLSSGYFNIVIPSRNNFLVNVNIEQPVVFLLHGGKKIESEDEINIEYQKGDIIFRVPPVIMTPEKVSSLIDNAVGGKSIWVSPENLLMKLYKMLSPFSEWDLVHLETIVGTIIRWKRDPRYPARLKYPYEPALFSIKVLPALISWPLGIAYENFTKSLALGMVMGRGFESDLEKVIFGKPLVEK